MEVLAGYCSGLGPFEIVFARSEQLHVESVCLGACRLHVDAHEIRWNLQKPEKPNPGECSQTC